MVQGMLLDIDGTLVLSNDAHARSWVEAFAKFGREVEYERVRKLMGMGGDQLIPTLFPDLSKDGGVGKQVSEYRTQLVLERYVHDMRPAPGARELLEELRRRGIKLGLASSAGEPELKALLSVVPIGDLLQAQTTSSDADQSKPAPDIVQVALEQIGLPAEAVLMLGDSPYDIEAARQAGVGVVAVRCGGFSDDELAGARAIYNDPADLLAHLNASPVVT
jgi:HAD superfamily hydrolase (TIGR01549 family)